LTNRQSAAEHKSAERLAFEHYIRTGQRLPIAVSSNELEQKFNPYHDPRNGRFTFAPGGPHSLGPVVISNRHGLHRGTQLGTAKLPELTSSTSAGEATDAVYRPSESTATLEPAQYRPNPRVGMGGNGGPPLNDPMTLERVFPGLAASPGGSLLAVADNILDLTGPANRLTTELTEAHVNKLISQIRTIAPNYRLDTLGFPTTVEGQANLIRQLRLDRAAAFYRVRGETRPLQVETLRLMQERADRAYDEGVALSNAGRLSERLSREEAIGNYVDRAVRRDLRELYNERGIDISKGQQVRVVGREYDTSGSDQTFRIPDARVGNTAFDVTLSRKTLSTPQVRGFFNSDFSPDAVIIVRPKQLGSNSTYVIARPRK